MASANNIRQAGTAVLVIFLTAALVWFGNGLNPLWPLMWIAMLPVLWFSLRSSWRSTAIVAAVSMLLGCLNMLHYLHGVLGAPVLCGSVYF